VRRHPDSRQMTRNNISEVATAKPQLMHCNNIPIDFKVTMKMILKLMAVCYVGKTIWDTMILLQYMTKVIYR
jgi:hypothetical protein